MAAVFLRKGRVKPVYLGHPWVFAQAVERLEGAPSEGDAVEVRDPGGRFLGRGFYSPKSAVVVRIVSRREDEPLDEAALARRIDRAMVARQSLDLPNERTTGYRLVNAEGDGLPGLTVDVFGDVAVMQVGTAGMRRHREALAAHVARVTSAKHVLATAVDQQKHEGFADDATTLRGPEPTELRFRERGFEVTLPLSLTQKTGYYLDQRDTRRRIEEHVWAQRKSAAQVRVLDLYAYVGMMGLSAARGGATEVLAFDSSASAIGTAARLSAHHRLPIVLGRADVRTVLSDLGRNKERFDIVVVDPPKLVPHRKHLERGSRAYGKLNQLAMALVREGGLLVTCSCSAAMTTEHFHRTLASAAASARRSLTLLSTHGPPADHPTPIAFAEGRYLDVVFARVER